MMEGGWPVLENHHLANAGCPILSLSCFPSLCPQGSSSPGVFACILPEFTCAYMCYCIYIYIYIQQVIYIYIYIMCIHIYVYIYD